jgi:hypothetical protein
MTQCKPLTASEPDDEIWRPKKIKEKTGASWKTISRARPDDVIQLGKRAVGMWKSAVLRPANRNR